MADEDKGQTVIIFFKDGSASPAYRVSSDTLDHMLDDFFNSLNNDPRVAGKYEAHIGSPTSTGHRKTKIVVDWSHVRMIG